MKIIYNWILIGFFAFLIFGLERLDIALFILVLLWGGSHYSIDKLRRSIRVLQTVNDGRAIILMERAGISTEEGEELLTEFENKHLTEKQRKALHEDMDYLGL